LCTLVGDHLAKNLKKSEIAKHLENQIKAVTGFDGSVIGHEYYIHVNLGYAPSFHINYWFKGCH
jgi:hypothetical protein